MCVFSEVGSLLMLNGTGRSVGSCGCSVGTEPCVCVCVPEITFKLVLIGVVEEVVMVGV